MLRKFLIPLLTFCAILPCAAQDYTADATLLRTEESYIVLECSGIARNKKEAVEMAKKSAIYTYLYIGINGFDKGRPLLGRNPSDEARAYADRILGTSSYANYIRNCTIDDNINKTAKRDVQVLAKIELYHVSLKRTLENAGVLKRSADEIELSETREAIAMPTVMVVPFRKNNESYEEAIRNNSDMRMAISKVNEGFINEGVETKDTMRRHTVSAWATACRSTT